MEIKVGYSGLEDRQVKVNEQEAKGLRMLFDNFNDPNWKHGDPIIGTMTFTDEQPPTTILEPVRDLAKEIDELRAKVAGHETRLQKDIGGHIR